MSTKMRAALLDEVGAPMIVVDDVELDGPGLGEVRVEVAWCGVCHSDVSQVDGVHPALTPSVLGHEAAGVVVEVGPGVTQLQVGDHVVLSPSAACGHCDRRVRNEHSSCVNSAAIAMSMLPDGSTRPSRQGSVVYRGLGLAAMAEYVVVAESAAIKIDADLPLDLACIIGCAVQTGRALRSNTAKVEAGATVLVMGVGGIGLSIVQAPASPAPRGSSCPTPSRPVVSRAPGRCDRRDRSDEGRRDLGRPGAHRSGRRLCLRRRRPRCARRGRSDRDPQRRHHRDRRRCARRPRGEAQRGADDVHREARGRNAAGGRVTLPAISPRRSRSGRRGASTSTRWSRRAGRWPK